MVETSGPDPGARPHRLAIVPPALATYGSAIVAAALTLLNILIISRALGPDGRGDVALLVTIVLITSYVASLGVQEANANLGAAEPLVRPALAANSLVLCLVFGIAGAGAVYALIQAIPAAGGDLAPRLVGVAVASIPLVILQTYLLYLVRSGYAFGVANVALLTVPAVNVVVNALLAVLGVLTLETAIGTWIGAQALATALLVWYVSRKMGGFGRPDGSLARRSVGFGLKTHLGWVMATGNFRLDQWLVGSIVGSRELGLYSVAVAWFETLFLLPTALALVLRPDLVRDTAVQASHRAAEAFRLASLATGLLALALVLAGPFLCVTILGDEFRGSVDDLRVLVPGAFGIVAVKILGAALTAQRRPLLETAAVGLGFAVTLLLDILLIPTHGGLGAAIASTLAYTAAGVMVGLLFLRSLGGRKVDLVPRLEEVLQVWRRAERFLATRTVRR